MAMASCYLFLPPLLLKRRAAFSSSPSPCFPLFSTPAYCTRPFTPPRCVGTEADLEDASSSDSTSQSSHALTESQRVAIAIGKGSNFVVFYSDHIALPTPEGHNLTVDKFRATRALLEGDLPLQNRLVTYSSPLASSEELCLVYEERHFQKVLDGGSSETESCGLSSELLTRSLASTGGVTAAMHLVMLGLRMAAASISGCREQGFSNHGQGVYMVPSGVFNDIAVAASVALWTYPDMCNQRRPILVVNLDVYQDNNTMEAFERDKRVVFFNMFGTNSFPRRSKAHLSYGVKLLDSTGDEYYLGVLSDWLQDLLDFHNPSLVFFQAGVDALSEDLSGKLSMTRQGLLQRNNIVYTACLARKIPLIITMGCGISWPLEVCVEAYADVYRSAALRYSASMDG